MKRLFFIGMLCMLCGAVNAEPVNLESAKKIAGKVIGKSSVTEVILSSEASSRLAVSPIEAPAFYMFNSEDGNGFAIVSGDDEFPEVIGYSETGRLNLNGTLPDALVAYLEGYSRYVADVRSGLVAPPVREGVGSATTNSVAPLCKSTWGQGYPYNGYCPKIGANTCPVGCVATAMAQIMYYYKHPERPQGGKIVYYTENSNIGSNGYITEDFSTDEHIYAWDLMRDDISMMNGTANIPSRNAVAQLSYDCGVATNMKYSLEGSGTSESEALYAFHKYFDYSVNTSLVFRDKVSSQEEWNALIKKELDEGRPVLFCGASTKGSGADAAGHAFIVDGYTKSGPVHVNWGWDGASDGYYDIVTLDMGQYAFSLEQSIVYGIQPSKEGETMPQSNLLCFYEPMEITATSVSLGKRYFCNLYKFYNLYPATKEWSVCIGLFDKHGNFISKIGQGSALEALGYLYGYSSYMVPCTLPKGTADGDYALRVMINETGYNLPNGEKDWILPQYIGGNDANWLPVMISNGIAYFNQVSTPIESIEIDAADVVSRQYFDLNGRSVAAPAEGAIVIEKQTLSNGKSRSVKRMF